MLINKKIFSLASITSKDPSRICMAGIRIEADGSGVVCNGHTLLKFTPNEPADPKDYPVLDGVNPVDINTADLNVVGVEPEPLIPFTLPVDACQDIAKALPRKSAISLLSNHVALDTIQTNANGHAVMATTDLETQKVFKPKKVAVTFPDYNKLAVPEATVEIAFAVAELQNIVTACKGMGITMIRFGIKDKESAAVLNATTEDGTVTGLLMPMRY